MHLFNPAIAGFRLQAGFGVEDIVTPHDRRHQRHRVMLDSEAGTAPTQMQVSTSSLLLP